MKNVELKRDLELAYSKFYDQDPTRCRYENSCGAGLPPKQLKCYKARVGECYEKEKLKILFVGREPVCSNECDREFLIEPPCSLKEANNFHWVRTFYTAANLLLESSDLPKDYSKETMCNPKYEELKNRFAFTNYYKCVFSENNKNSGKKVSRAMHENCCRILCEEIKVLKPNLVVFQGKYTWKGIEYKEIKEICAEQGEKRYCQGLYECRIGDFSFHALETYHPTSHGIWTNEAVQKNFKILLNEAKDRLK